MLSALLAAGFGVTWWGLVPPARADGPKPGPCLKPPAHTVAKRIDVKHMPTRRLVTLTIAKRIPPRIVKRPPIDVTPVNDPVHSPFAQPPPGWTGGVDPIRTPVAHPPRVLPPRRPLPPKVVPPVVDPDPIPVATPLQPPVVDPIPTPEPPPVIDDFVLPPTRSS